MIELTTLFLAILSIIVIPLIIYAFKQNGRIAVLETKVDYIDRLESKIDTLFTKIDDLKDEIHAKK
ncbi:hypothetical protein ALC152_03980 [Arcobacter sp. 15-2]|uniref:hypothetical protein n=1 Tax=Arcobacter sp. 15-2 TaxID=3374109 RepID=UPI00399C83CE